MEMEEINGQAVYVKKKKDFSGFGVGFLCGLFAMLIVVCGILIAIRINNKSESIGENGSKEELREIEVTEGSAINYDLVNKLQTLEYIVHKYYYKDDITAEQLNEGIYRGLLESLDDPYSQYYTEDEFRDLMESTEGIYYGIGAYVTTDKETGLPKISSVIPNTPAEEAKLRANDILYEVDGESTYGLSLEETVALIKGEENTQVLLTIIRDSEELQITAIRRKVETPTVEHEMLDNGMGYLQILEFDEVTVDQFSDAYQSLQDQQMKGLILDLRSNPGGSMDAVVEIARMLLPEGLVVYTEDRNGSRREYECDGSHEIDIPLVVLIDMNSASAAEILAGAIKDYGKGTLIGTTTFGKGIVQQIVPLKDGSAIKVTVSSYYTPKGVNIHGIGIEPDIEVEFDGETYYSTEDNYDNQLEKAKEVLGGMINQ